MENTKLSDLKESCNSYFTKRLTELQVTENDLLVSATFEHGRTIKVPLFSQCEEGISITYLDPFGNVQYYTQKGKQKQFLRLRRAKPLNGEKYSQPYKSGIFPFITPQIINKVKTKVEIETLFVVEGEFKAFALTQHLGIDAIAIPGIQSFVEKESNELHQDIQIIIKECKVKTLVLLFDADCLDLTDNFEKDLYDRPFGFYNAIKRFKDYTKPLNIDLYFTHIKSNFTKIAKGIDDLILHPNTKKAQLKKELYSFTTGNKDYLECLNVTGNSINKVLKYFNLETVKEFYVKFQDVIQEREFIWKGNKYYHDGEKLKISWYGAASQYMRVASNYYKKIHSINSRGELEEVIQPWSPAEINRDFGNNKEFFKQIPRYDIFCNRPDHTNDYQKVITAEKDGIITKAYNIYSKVDHKIKPGKYENIEKFLKHIANSKNLAGESLFEFLLDWIQICYQNPTQMLPVLCLVSKERNTGKSTFLTFLKLIFKGNATILDNERFTGKFTSHYISKLIIGVDESFIRTDQAHIKERIKNLAVGKTQWLEGKGRDAQEIDYFGKLILCSNNESNFMQIDTDENRHCVLKVPVLLEFDPDLLTKMESEIPCFLHFITNRTLYYPKKTRSWFEFDVFKTEAMQAVQERTKNRIEREILEYITEIFQKTNQISLEFTPKDLAIGLNSYLQLKTSPTSIKDHLIDMGFKPQIQKRYDLYNSEGNLIENKPGTPYLFFRSDFIKDEDLF